MLFLCGCVQILDVGEVAVQFVQDVRGCFPTLVRRNPMSSAPDSDDESGDDEDDDDGANAKRRLEKEEAKHREEQRQQQQQDARTREAVAYMDRARIKMLTSLDELFHAFQILKHAQVHSALQRDASTHSGTCQWLCIDLPAAQPSPSSAATNGTGATSTVHNVGVMFSHAVASPKDAQFLRIPLPRTPNGFFSSDDDGSTQDGEGDSATEIFQDATVLSFGAKREATAHGGGKTPDEMVRNIRMRHASGTFCSLVNPETTWGEVAAKYTTFLPQVHEIHGDLRVRRIMGPAANEPVAFLLEK